MIKIGEAKGKILLQKQKEGKKTPIVKRKNLVMKHCGAASPQNSTL